MSEVAIARSDLQDFREIRDADKNREIRDWDLQDKTSRPGDRSYRRG